MERLCRSTGLVWVVCCVLAGEEWEEHFECLFFALQVGLCGEFASEVVCGLFVDLVMFFDGTEDAFVGPVVGPVSGVEVGFEFSDVLGFGDVHCVCSG